MAIKLPVRVSEMISMVSLFQKLLISLLEKDNPAQPIDRLIEASRPYVYKRLCEYIKTCTLCDISVNGQHCPTGNYDSDLMIVYDYPQGDSSKEIDEILKIIYNKCSIERDKIYEAYSICCNPARKTNMGTHTSAPTREHIANCVPYLLYSIRMVNPAQMIVFGQTAYKSLFPHNNEAKDNTILYFGTIRCLLLRSPEVILAFKNDEELYGSMIKNTVEMIKSFLNE